MGDHMDYQRHRPSYFGIKREPRDEMDEDDEDLEDDDYDDDSEDPDEIWDDSQGWWPADAIRVPTDFGKPWDQAEHNLVR
jgi:hypothetical protein